MTEQQIRQFLRDEMRVVQAERQDAFCEMLQKFLEYQKAVVKNCSIPNVGRSLSSAEYVEGLSKEVLDRMHQNTTVVTNENDRDIWDTAFILGYYGGLEGK